MYVKIGGQNNIKPIKAIEYGGNLLIKHIKRKVKFQTLPAVQVHGR